MTQMLFEPFDLSGLLLPNRIVMPPMTRARAAPGQVPTDTMAKYYAQRASAGLIITEGAQISAQGQGYAWTPGIHTSQQVDGWKNVTAAVHKAGGRIFAQLWHVGRLSHVSLQPGGVAPVAPSAYSAPNWTPIPRQTGHRFRGKLDTHSSANWTLIPLQTGQFEAA